jgi:DNA repair exonuclease SbcCD ATPase subunit
MILKKLRVLNYQSHRDSELTFSPGVNIILGDPQSGKSALLRAFMWLATNRPLGARLRSTFAGKGEDTVVSAEFGDHAVTHTRGPGGSTYYVDGESFKGFGDGMPETVLKALNLNELNVQPQLEPFFLITSSPQEIARAINRITRLEKVDDEWMPKLTRLIGELRTLGRALSEDVATLERRQAGFVDLPALREDLNKANDIAAAQVATLREGLRLEALIVSAYNLKRLLKSQEGFTALAGAIREIDSLRQRADELGAEGQIITQVLMLDRQVKASKALGELGTTVDEIDRLLEGKWELQAEWKLIDQAKAVKVDLTAALRECDDRMGRLAKAMRKAGRCPMCYSKIDDAAIGRLEDELLL